MRLLLIVLLLAWAVRSLLFAPFSIPSASMFPALFVGDYVLAAKWPYGYSRYSFPFGVPGFEGRILARLPERGDIVVFRAPVGKTDFVKRVIGLPGDSVELRRGTLLLNGRPLRREAAGLAPVPVPAHSPCPLANRAPSMTADRKTCLYPVYREQLPGGRSYTIVEQAGSGADEFPATIVPEGHLFLIGDNRDDSLDSRYPVRQGGVGFVPLENLVGQATLVFWSTDGSAEYPKPWTWFSALRGDRIAKTFGDSR